ncbi:hypothetical protein ACFQZJ_08675 [Maribacter chungangensis]|uniref:Cytochrome c n=1 Tax=Maribacter chungangensis TaxID=1069117 RepID=A0ABW3B3B0_9FLAO
MKKLGSIVVLLVMALGLTASVAENTGDEFEFMKDLNSMLACGNCSQSHSDRDPPKPLT